MNNINYFENFFPNRNMTGKKIHIAIFHAVKNQTHNLMVLRQQLIRVEHDLSKPNEEGN